MSTQTISDYITKQIFIEKNIVTFRSLSRQFSLHVDAARNELATYHHNAPYQSQNSCATFLLTGTPKRKDSRYGDIEMDQSQGFGNLERRASDEDDSDQVFHTTVLLVNEKDLEGAKAQYDVIESIYVYSLAPAPLIDPGLICACTESVRTIDKSNGAEWAAKVGRVALNGIKTGPLKKAKVPVAPAAVAGPSKSNSMPIVTTKTEPVKPEGTIKQTSSLVSISETEKDRNNKNGKLNFFTKGKTVKKEDSVANLNKKNFFSKPVEATSTKPSIKIEKEITTRDNTRTKAKTPEKLPDAEPSTKGIRRKGTIVLSDDESDEMPVKGTRRRKSRASLKSESSFAVDSDAEREAHALMDLDDDQVERVSHAPSTAASEFEDQSDADSAPMETEKTDGDVEMADNSAVPKRSNKRKAKSIVPVGRNGLKKRKVTKTRTGNVNGYINREDYSDWESVNEEEPEPEAKHKTKPKTTKVKKNADNDQGNEDNSATTEGTKQKREGLTRKKSVIKPMPATVKTKDGKTQKRLMTFFGPTKKT